MVTRSSLKSFLRSRALWVGLVAVVVPLLVNLGLQYRSLSELETAMPWARRMMLRKYLQDLNMEVTRLYKAKAETILSLPADAFDPEFESDLAAQHFSKQSFEGAKRFFVGYASKRGDLSYAVIMFYDPARNAMVRDPESPEWHAAHAGSAGWMALEMTDAKTENPRISVDDRDPKNRILAKPVLSSDKKVVGVVGMVLDDAWFRDKCLPEAIKNTLPKAFPKDSDQVIVTVHDKWEKLIYANQTFTGQAYEVGGSPSFVFTDLYLGIRMRDATEDQLARRYFVMNFSLSMITALVLLGGIVFALRAASRAMRFSQMKADFVSNVSHELRTPLASIRVFGEFLKLGRVNDDTKVKEYGAYIETESRRLTQLINNILDFSKIESGQKTYQFERTDIIRTVADAISLANLRLESQGFTVNFKRPAAPLPEVLLDCDAFSQAVMNLLDNAMKYSGTVKQLEVSIGTRPGYVTVSVSDNGIGIAKDELDKIFDKFYRVSTGLVHDVKGSGLGLSIVKHVMEAHGGSVSVESVPNVGTTFTLHLPCLAQIEQAPEASSTPSAEKINFKEAVSR